MIVTILGTRARAAVVPLTAFVATPAEIGEQVLGLTRAANLRFTRRIKDNSVPRRDEAESFRLH